GEFQVRNLIPPKIRRVCGPSVGMLNPTQRVRCPPAGVTWKPLELCAA
ncbi:hypothetical protein AVEN_34243-1, partial [Araneus ventricosus]